MSSAGGPFPDPLKDAAYASSWSSGHLNYQCHTGLQSPTIDLLQFRYAESYQGLYVPGSGLGPETRLLTSRHSHAGQGTYRSYTQYGMESAITITELGRVSWGLCTDKSRGQGESCGSLLTGHVWTKTWKVSTRTIRKESSVCAHTCKCYSWKKKVEQSHRCNNHDDVLQSVHGVQGWCSMKWQGLGGHSCVMWKEYGLGSKKDLSSSSSFIE